MTITFCGHSDFIGTDEYKKQLLALLDRLVGDRTVDFYLGNYGGFDKFAFSCCRQFKESHPNSTLVFVTPYCDPRYLEHHLPVECDYDEILYPEIEDKPLKFAISYRNKYMVEKADIVIAYIAHNFGGAYKTYEYARKKKKEIYNLFVNKI